MKTDALLKEILVRLGENYINNKGYIFKDISEIWTSIPLPGTQISSVEEEFNLKWDDFWLNIFYFEESIF